MKYGNKLKLDRVPKHKEGKRDFAPAARRKNFFESIVATAKGSKAEQNGYPLQVQLVWLIGIITRIYNPLFAPIFRFFV